jgi:hypothetical protein
MADLHHVVVGPTRDDLQSRLYRNGAYTWHWGQRNDDRPLTLIRTIVLLHRRHA